MKDFLGHDSLVHLELKKNKLVDMSGAANMESLQELYLNENEITNFSSLKNLPKLRKLDLNMNKIARLKDLPTLPALEHLDLGGNVIEKADGDIPSLAIYPTLKTLIMAANPFADALGDKLKIEVLLTLRKIKFVGEEEINDEDRVVMKEEAKERKKAAIAAAIEAEKLVMERAAAGEEPLAEGDGDDVVVEGEAEDE
jgi:Leucine rich repeat